MSKLTFDCSVGSGQPTDDAVLTVALVDVQLGTEESVGWLRVDEGHGDARLQGDRKQRVNI